MSINEKNRRLLNAAQSSQWKIVPKPDESDDAPVVPSPTDQENRPGGQDFRHRLLRDATAFYRNDTSHFLGELQKAESLLYQKVNLISKIDFLPSKRKTSPLKERQETPDRGFDEQLSDAGSDIATVQRIVGKKRKSDEEPEKLIVDVNDFIDTFSLVREPVYHQVNKKKPVDCDRKTEYDFLLDRVPLKRENDNDRNGETPGHVADFAERLPPGNLVAGNLVDGNVKFVHEPSIVSRDVLSFVDDPIVFHDTIQHPAHFAIGIVEAVYPCRPEILQPVPENNREQESSIRLNESDGSVERTVPDENIFAVEDQVRDATVKKTEAETEACAKVKTAVPGDIVPSADRAADVTEADDALAAVDDATGVDDVAVGDVDIDDAADADVAENETSTTFFAQLPGIIEHLGEFAGDQCDVLADYIKDKVYDGSRLIAFCGMKRGVGCSTMTLLAAWGIMRHGLKTAVIDANFEFPNLNALVAGQAQNEESWVNILHGTVAWETLGITPKDMPMLTVFPLAQNALANWSQYEPERLQQETNRFVSTLQESFDLILLDCGCFENAFEEITWGELALFQPDGVILVRNPKETPFEMLEPCCRDILNGGIGAYGVAENFV